LTHWFCITILTVGGATTASMERIKKYDHCGELCSLQALGSFRRNGPFGGSETVAVKADYIA